MKERALAVTIVGHAKTVIAAGGSMRSACLSILGNAKVALIADALGIPDAQHATSAGIPWVKSAPPPPHGKPGAVGQQRCVGIASAHATAGMPADRTLTYRIERLRRRRSMGGAGVTLSDLK
jgi:hypothetical protein